MSAAVGEDLLGAVRRVEAELTRLVRAVKRQAGANAQLVHPDLSGSGYHVLLYVVAHGPVRASEVCAALDMDKGAVSRQVQHLEELGLVTRVEDADDRRAQQLVLSEAGSDRIDRLRETRSAELTARLADWPAVELESFADRLARYNATFEG